MKDIHTVDTCFAQDKYVDVHKIVNSHGYRAAVIVKRIRPRFNEAIVALLNTRLTQGIGRTDLIHPHLCPVYLLGVPDQSYLLMVTTHYENGNVLEYLARNPTANVMKLIVQVASALEYLHDKDVAHGNIKATNVLIDDNGAVRLSDVQLNVALRSMDVLSSGRARPPRALGYKPPEEIQPSPQAPPVHFTKPGDVYALAVLVYEICAQGTYNPSRRSALQCAESHANFLRNDAAAKLEQPLWWELLLECWDEDPVRRPSAKEVKRKLEEGNL
ncbi:kinase-like protein [Neolentinus lepideus HHB14362 ss-1]|uniref:Kinase-like protein n=1 Tax=Neolentinus lepideus HHB14362 ss-1 TaxID=1314782 RepID=A0A165VUW2_9AGAM|nr:kinase-like protein [Neolentinus lepideus HHB14362 ss-1]